MRTKLMALVGIALCLGGAVAIGAARVPQAGRGAATGPCDRACLQGFVEQYLEAWVARDPKRLAVANPERRERRERRLHQHRPHLQQRELAGLHAARQTRHHRYLRRNGLKRWVPRILSFANRFPLPNGCRERISSALPTCTSAACSRTMGWGNTLLPKTAIDSRMQRNQRTSLHPLDRPGRIPERRIRTPRNGVVWSSSSPD